jgi:ankyrin repeat protein
MLACCLDRKEAVRILLELGADVNAKDADGRTPLMYATDRNAIDSTKLLLSENDIKLEIKDNTGSTALLRAASRGSYEILKLLVQAGANVNTINYPGESALTHVIKQKNSVVSELLIQYGADINYSDKLGNTPLIEAAKNDVIIVAKQLIKLGTNTSSKDINQNTAFLVAAENNSSQVLALLIDFQEISEEEYLQAVIKAAMNGNIDATDTLLKKSKNPAKMAFAALNSACLKNNSDIVHICMDYNCNINDTLYCGMTPLMLACYVNAERTAAQLIAYEADINKADEDGITALMYTASKNNLNLLNLLMRNGAERDLKDKSGHTFEDYTNSYDNRSYSQLIFDRVGSKVLSTRISFKESIPKVHQSFSDRFDWYLQQYWKRFPNNKQSNIYKDGGITKQHFSKILSNRKPDFRPEKDTVLKLALGLQLTLNETEDFLHSAGYVFSEKNKKDAEIKNLFSEKNYRLFDWSERIYEVAGKVFFNAVIECEEEE